MHEAGALRFEDLEIEDTLGPKVLDHVAIDRFTGGAREKYKFDDEPLIGTPGRPICLKGRFWIKEKIFSDEDSKNTLKNVVADIASGCYKLGSKGSIGYGWINRIEITDGPPWLKGKFPECPTSKGDSLPPINITDLLKNDFTFTLQE